MKYTSLSLRALAAQSRLFLAVHPAGVRSPEELRVSTHHYIALAPTDIAEGVSVVDWVYGLTVDEIGQGVKGTLVRAGGRVYACIARGEGESTVMPEGDTQHWPNDGWGWQYVGESSRGLSQRFAWSGLFPYTSTPTFSVISYDTRGVEVRPEGYRGMAWPSGQRVNISQGRGVSASHYPRSLPFGSHQYAILDSNNTSVYTRARASVDLASGAISGVTVTEAGQGYESVKVVVFGDGSGAVLRPETSNGVVTGLVVESQGSGYTWADVFLVPESSVVCPAIVPDFYSWFDAKTIISKVVSPIADGLSNAAMTLVATERAYPDTFLARGPSAPESPLPLIDSVVSPVIEVSRRVDSTKDLQVNIVITQD